MMMIGIGLSAPTAPTLAPLAANIFLVVAITLILKHMIEGIENVVCDYIHNVKVKILIQAHLRVHLAIVFKYSYSFFILL